MAGALGLLFGVLGVFPALAGLGVMLLLLPFNLVMVRYLTAIRKRLIGWTDQRVQLVTEVIHGIKAIKLYAWEAPFLSRIQALRDNETAQVRTSVFFGEPLRPGLRLPASVRGLPREVEVPPARVYLLGGQAGPRRRADHGPASNAVTAGSVPCRPGVRRCAHHVCVQPAVHAGGAGVFLCAHVHGDPPGPGGGLPRPRALQHAQVARDPNLISS